jgi:flagellar hook assembly protein FlgD
VLVLDGNYPNPFRSGTNIVYRLSRDADVDIKIFTISGETVRHDKGIQGRAGMNSYPWDGRNSAGKAAASGTYLYKIHAKTMYNEESYFISKMACVR